MSSSDATDPIPMGFEAEGVVLPISDIQPLRLVGEAVKKTSKYAQIVASIREVGIIEPPLVARSRGGKGKYILLDGHLRLEALKDLGENEVVCLISTDDEAYTYNKHVCRLAIIQEHKMILKAIERGVSSERIAKALNVDAGSIKEKVRLLDGICPEAADLLKDKFIPINSFRVLKKLAPMRQIEAAELMVGMNNYTTSYANSLLAATPQAHLVEGNKPKKVKGLSDEQIALMERESAGLDREFKMIERSYGTDHLDLTLAIGYLGSIVANTKLARYLAQHHAAILLEFQKMVQVR